MAKYSTIPESTLLVDRWHSACNNCGKETLSDTRTHRDITGYQPEFGGGCGIVFTHIASEYVGPGVKELVKEMRGDLEYIEIFPDHPAQAS